MNNKTFWLQMARLDLFDGSQAAAASTGDSAGAGSTAGEPASTSPNDPAAGDQITEGTPSQPASDQRRQQWQDLIQNQYKDLYTEDTQRIINRRFREKKESEAALRAQQPVIDILLRRYDLPGGDMVRLKAALLDDPAFAAHCQTENDPRVDSLKLELEQARRREGQQAVSHQMETWHAQAKAMQDRYPHFDLRAESQDPAFIALLKTGLDVKTAYEARHLEEILGAVHQQAQAGVLASIRAGNARPAENGASPRSGLPVKDDVSGLSRKDRAHYIKRAAKGESIRF